MKREILVAFLGLGLAGCLGSAPPVPRDHYYRLLVPGPAAENTARVLKGVVIVELLEADGLLRERPLLYSQSGGAHEVQQHDYHYWTASPPHMLQDQMVSFLRRSGLAGSVVTPDMRIRPDYQVRGKAKRLERLLGGGEPRVFVEIELALVRLSDNTLVIVDTYTEQEPAPDNDIETSVIALNRATTRIFERFLSQILQAASELPDRQEAGLTQ